MTVWDFFVWFFWFYVLITCIWIFITVIVDIFRDHTLNGWAKALWVIFLVILPFLGAFIYLIARGRSMAERGAQRSREATAETTDYIRSVAGTHSAATEIESAKRLLDSGAITQAEYDTLKAKALGQPAERATIT
ncbi:MAG TPA: SHOCT domain-containing protein [Agromyces sp.]|nr:SHOCT domain-containing protein [Agromyces sp.]